MSAPSRWPAVEYVDVFTDTIGHGNRAGVVLDARGLDAADMQAIAAGAGATETAFGFPGPRGTDLEVRYFSGTRELPLCGHATVGFHYLRAVRLDLSTCRLRVQTGAGILALDIIRTPFDHRIIMTQAAPRIVATLTAEQDAALALALGLTDDDRIPELPAQVVTTGHAKLLVPLRGRAALDRLRPDRAALLELAADTGAPGVFAFALPRVRACTAPELLYHGRMFAPATGVDEDPVTGNAHGPAGFYLAHHRVLAIPIDGERRYVASQGDAMGRPGRVEVILGVTRGTVHRVQISGHAVVVPPVREPPSGAHAASPTTSPAL